MLDTEPLQQTHTLVIIPIVWHPQTKVPATTGRVGSLRRRAAGPHGVPELLRGPGSTCSITATPADCASSADCAIKRQKRRNGHDCRICRGGVIITGNKVSSEVDVLCNESSNVHPTPNATATSATASALAPALLLLLALLLVLPLLLVLLPALLLLLLLLLQLLALLPLLFLALPQPLSLLLRTAPAAATTPPLPEDTTAMFMGEQHRRLSDRLRVQQIPHQALPNVRNRALRFPHF